MSRQPLIASALLVLGHIALVAPYVPLANVLPVSLGAISMSSMALSLVLAARWRLVDRLTGGPDKSYVAHRWLGFFALGGALGHWAMAESLGGGAVPLLAEFAEGVGWLAAVGLLLLSAAALVRAVPYHLWKASHMLMGPIFLFAAFHTVIVASPLAVGVAPWSFMAAVSLVGLAAWGQTLLRKIEPTRLVAVERVRRFAGGVDVTFRADNSLPKFKPGQFATIANTHASAEAHPSTIAGGDETARRFIIRAAGDWTDTFVSSVAEGDRYRLGCGVGRFLPQTHKRRSEQLWVAGGVGITPFLAALEQMQLDGSAQVTLIFCIRSRASSGGIEDVEKHARRLPQVELIVLSDSEGDMLTRARLMETMCEMSDNAQVYVCGPKGLKALVTTAWAALGKSGRVHCERFDFRGAYGLTDLIYIGKPVVAAARNWMAGRKDLANEAAGT